MVIGVATGGVLVLLGAAVVTGYRLGYDHGRHVERVTSFATTHPGIPALDISAVEHAQHNLLNLITWSTSHNEHPDPLTLIDVRSPGHLELEPDGTLNGGIDPPTAA